jgi:hypothetical protein
MYILPESILEVMFFITMLLLGYQAILDITTTNRLREVVNELDHRVEELEKKVYLEAKH